MPRSDQEDAVDRLYAAPLEEFVAERTRLAKELRKGGDRPAAAELAKLAKPSAAAWALNHVAREDPGAMGEWLEAADALRDASTHASEVGGDAVRGAMAEHRTATTRLTGLVRDRAQPSGRPLSDAMLDRVRWLLQAATADARLAERLRAGQITEEQAEAEAEEEPEAESKPRAAKARPAPEAEPKPRAAKSAPKAEAEPEAPPAKAARPKRDRAAELQAKRRAELERRVGETTEELERLQALAEERAAAADTAEERVEDARRALNRAESEVGAARDAAADAEEAAAAAERDLQQLRARLRRLGD